MAQLSSNPPTQGQSITVRPQSASPPPSQPPGGNGREDYGDPQQNPTRTEAFDQPVILQQTPMWSRAIVWSIMGVTVFTVGWAAVARVDEAVQAQGRLEPTGRVQDVQVPINGVVDAILVEEGDRVERGQVLIRLDPTASEAQLESLKQVLQSLEQENAFYRATLFGQTSEMNEAVLNLPPEMLSLTTNRSTILAENQIFQSLLTGAPGNLSAEQMARLQSQQTEASSRISAAQLEVAQLEQQLQQNRIESEATQRRLETNQSILSDLTPLFEEGGIAKLQYTRQQQQVLDDQAEVARLREEERRVQYAIAQAEQRFTREVAVTNTDFLNRLAENNKRLADIDSQLNKTIVQNDQRIADLRSQISQAEQQIRYQTVRAPISGVVFDLQTQDQGVVGSAGPSQSVLKIVPSDSLIARVYISNRDIGFVEPGMDVDVRVDSYSYSEYGDIKGRVVRIGSDSLPPDPQEMRQTYMFPATIELDQQSLVIRGTERPLQSGMSVSANIKTDKRTVLSLFTDLFRRKVDNVTTTR
jgi:hemolysin D